MVARGHDGTTGSDTASVDLPGGTQSIQRALAVLRILATARESGLGLSEISMHAGLTRPTTHRILSVLVAEGIVEQRLGTRRYVVGEQIPLLALSRRTRDPLLDIVSPHLRAAVGEFGDTGFFTRRVGLETVCVARELGTYPIQALVGMLASAAPLVSPMPELRSYQACRPTRCAAYSPRTDRAFLGMAYRRRRSCGRWR